MASYESFYTRNERGGKIVYLLRVINLTRIESWEAVDAKHTKIFTKSGDVFIAKVDYEELTDKLMSLYDEYGRLLTFYTN